MAMLIMEAIGPRGEELAMAAGRARGIAVGWDPKFNSATYDADAIADEDLQTVIFEQLEAQDPEWGTQLQPVD